MSEYLGVVVSLPGAHAVCRDLTTGHHWAADVGPCDIGAFVYADGTPRIVTGETLPRPELWEAARRVADERGDVDLGERLWRETFSAERVRCQTLYGSYEAKATATAIATGASLDALSPTKRLPGETDEALRYRIAMTPRGDALVPFSVPVYLTAAELNEAFPGMPGQDADAVQRALDNASRHMRGVRLTGAEALSGLGDVTVELGKPQPHDPEQAKSESLALVESVSGGRVGMVSMVFLCGKFAGEVGESVRDLYESAPRPGQLVSFHVGKQRWREVNGLSLQVPWMWGQAVQTAMRGGLGVELENRLAYEQTRATNPRQYAEAERVWEGIEVVPYSKPATPNLIGHINGVAYYEDPSLDGDEMVPVLGDLADLAHVSHHGHKADGWVFKERLHPDDFCSCSAVKARHERVCGACFARAEPVAVVPEREEVTRVRCPKCHRNDRISATAEVTVRSTFDLLQPSPRPITAHHVINGQRHDQRGVPQRSEPRLVALHCRVCRHEWTPPEHLHHNWVRR